MRTLSLMICLIILMGCRTPDVVKITALQDEIATIGSVAQIAGPRTELQRFRIQQDVAKAQAHVLEVSK